MRIFWSFVVLFGMLSGMLFREENPIVWLLIGLFGLAGVWSWGRALSSYYQTAMVKTDYGRPFVTLLLAILLTGCGTQDTTSSECQQKMDGTLDGQYILSENEEERYKINSPSIPDSLQDGDEITVTYSSILESYPLQLSVCEINER
jgi:hypothetical protein